MVTHVDVIPAGKDECMAALKAMSADTARDPGNISYEVLQQANRRNHFTVIERWTNRKALNAHTMAAHTRAFRGKIARRGRAIRRAHLQGAVTATLPEQRRRLFLRREILIAVGQRVGRWITMKP